MTVSTYATDSRFETTSDATTLATDDGWPPEATSASVKAGAVKSTTMITMRRTSMKRLRSASTCPPVDFETDLQLARFFEREISIGGRDNYVVKHSNPHERPGGDHASCQFDVVWTWRRVT